MKLKTGILKVRVKTGAPKTQILGWEHDVLKIAVNARPEKGRANAEIVKFFKRELKKDVKIVKGLKSKNKVLSVR